MPFRKHCHPKKAKLARKMRNHPTPAEASLWKSLHPRPFGFRFKHQEVILGWIADFYCAAAKLVVEVDGPYHSEQAEKDRYRDIILAKRGIMTLRFSNDAVLNSKQHVLAEIGAAVKNLALPDRSRAVGRSKEPTERSTSRGDVEVSRRA